MRIAIAAALLIAAQALSACTAETEPAPVTAPAPAPAAAGEYPLATCPVSGEPLGSMGDPVKVSFEGVEVRLCCKNCVKEFDRDPKKFADMVVAARKK